MKNERTVGKHLVLLSALCLVAATTASQDEEEFRFHDARKQTEEFIGYFQTIQLTAEQEAVKRQALGPLPAPCCSDNSAYTCCCVCNLSRTIWGLSHHLIAKRGYDAEKVRETVVRWVNFIGPNGFRGNACYSGGCYQPFSKGGCGGMRAEEVVW